MAGLATRGPFGVHRTPWRTLARRSRDPWASALAASLVLAGCGDTGEDILASVTDPAPQAPPITYCPTHTRVVVTPLQVSIGSDGEMHAMADSQAVSFSWTGTRGVSISTPTRPDALFTCLKPGPQTLTLRATGPGACVTRYDVPVTCAP